MNSSSLFLGISLLSITISTATARKYNGNCGFRRELLAFTYGDYCIAYKKWPVCSGLCPSFTYFDLQDNGMRPHLKQNCECCVPDTDYIRSATVKLKFVCPYGHYVKTFSLPKFTRNHCKCSQCSRHLVKWFQALHIDTLLFDYEHPSKWKAAYEAPSRLIATLHNYHHQYFFILTITLFSPFTISVSAYIHSPTWTQHHQPSE